MFTPIIIIENWIFDKWEFIGRSNRRGIQWYMPARIANTAPIDST